MTRLTLTFDYEAHRYNRSAAWRAAERARADSGTTSIRVSKATSRALVELAARMLAAIPKDERYWRDDRVTPDELVAALCAGAVELVAPRVELPAPDPRQLALPIVAGQARRVHAKHDRTVHACNGIPLHAKPDVGRKRRPAAATARGRK